MVAPLISNENNTVSADIRDPKVMPVFLSAVHPEAMSDRMIHAEYQIHATRYMIGLTAFGCELI